MKYPRFNSDQVVKIENKEQFDQIYHVLRSAQNGICLEKWLEEISGGYPKFPIYLEHSNSGFGPSIGFTSEPKNTWTKREYEVLSFDQACR